MIEINLYGNKVCSGFYRGQFKYPVERAAILSSIKKFPGTNLEQIKLRLDLEKSIIKDVIADLYDQGKIIVDISGRLFLADGDGGAIFE